MKKACEHLQNKHFPCFAHTINLLVQEILKMEVIRPVLTKCKTVVAFIKNSSTAMAKFKDALMVADPLGLIQEVPTRWNSAFEMIERILKTKEALSIALLGTAKAPEPFSADKIDVLDELCSLLRPFEKATKLISGGNTLLCRSSFRCFAKWKHKSCHTKIALKAQKPYWHSTL